MAYQRSVNLPSGHVGITTSSLATSLRSLANELDRIGFAKVKGIKIDPVERKIVVTLEGEDPRKEVDLSPYQRKR
jgi:hypothetical protein